MFAPSRQEHTDGGYLKDSAAGTNRMREICLTELIKKEASCDPIACT